MLITTRISPFKVLFRICVLFLLVESGSTEVTENAITSSNEVFVISLVLSAAVFLVLCSVVLFLCGDCYNSEVSTSTHPACGGNKWGGSDGFHGTASQDINTSVMQSSHTFGETVNPGNQGLPYAMISSQIQTEHQFVGYQSTPETNTAGYPSGDQPQPQMNRYDGGGLQRGGGGMHVNPLEDAPEEPPPSYNEALRTGM